MNTNFIKLVNAGIRYNHEWIFRNLNFEFTSTESTVILGGNGSGKSTLLKLISGYNSPSEGEVAFNLGNKIIVPEQLYSHISFASPYIDIIEEFTLTELLEFHFSLKPSLNNLSVSDMIELLDLQKSSGKSIRYFSSGMKQRVKVGLALFTSSEVLLLDEPTSNFDKKNTDWYCQMLSKFKGDRILIVCSNHQQREYELCTRQLLIEDFKVNSNAPLSSL